MKFRIRDFEPGEMIAREPNLRVLEIVKEYSPANTERFIFALTSGDIAALNALAFAINSHESLPIEAGEP